MRLIQRFFPKPTHRETHRIFVKAAPAETWETARHFDMGGIPWVRLLFDIRTIPDRLKGKLSREDRRIGVDQIAASNNGFMVLGEDPGKEVVVGAIGRFWNIEIPFQKLVAEEFSGFDEPGFGKIAWCIRVDPYLEGSTVAFDLRIGATDEKSWSKFQRYYKIIGVASRLIRRSFMHQLEKRLGKLEREDEELMGLPGDQLLPDCRIQATHAIDIEAPTCIVWRYLMQMGCDRGGWYSIDLLDNAGIPSEEEIIDEWTDRRAGDQIAATPKKEGYFEVYEVEKEKHFILGASSKKYGLLKPFEMTWSFVLQPMGDEATRLIARARMKAEPPWAEWLMGNVVYPPVHGLMAFRQMNTIKRVAEKSALKEIPETLTIELN